MQEIKMFPMGFGESILLTGGDECLLVDCGSESECYDLYFENVLNEIKKYRKKSAMLTHFHTDHINGFMWIAKRNPGIFDTVYIPDVFGDRGTRLFGINYIDLEIVQYILEKIYYPKSKTITLWDLLTVLCDSRLRVRPLSRKEKAFECVYDQFDVLWPVMADVVGVRLGKKLNSIIPEELWQRIHPVSEDIRIMFIRLSEGRFEPEQPYTENDQNRRTIAERIDALVPLFYEAVGQMTKHQARQIINSIKQNANGTSIVCQNYNAEKRVLLTGDAPPSSLDRVAKYWEKPMLRDKYNVIKVPHHGTDTYFFNFGCYTEYNTLAISNGETEMNKRGAISRQYNLLRRDFRMACTNTRARRCQCQRDFPKVRCNKKGDVCGCLYPDGYILL